MDLVSYLRMLRKNWWLLLVFVIVGLIAAGTYVSLAPREYKGKTALYFSAQSGTEADLTQAAANVDHQVKSFAKLAVSPVVLEPVLLEKGMGITAADFSKKVSADIPSGTSIIEISVIDRDPVKAADLASGVGKQLTIVARELSPRTDNGISRMRITVTQPAGNTGELVSPRTISFLGLGMLVALAVGVAVMMIRDRYDNRVSNVSDIMKISSRQLIATIPYDKSAKKTPLLAAGHRSSPRSEAVRILRTNVGFFAGDEHASLLVTSSIPGEGKTVTALNLAVAMGKTGKRVLLIDADLRSPSLHNYAMLDQSPGLSEVLTGNAKFDEVTATFDGTTVCLLTCGQNPANPSELLESAQMKQLLRHATAEFDAVIVDSSPLLPVTDAAVLSGLVDGVLLVVGHEQVGKQQLENALKALNAVDAEKVALVYNRAKDNNEMTMYRYSSAQ